MGWAGGQGLDCSIPPGSPAILSTESTPGSGEHQRCMAGEWVIESTNLPTFSLPGPSGVELRSGWHQDGRALPLLRPLHFRVLSHWVQPPAGQQALIE